MKKAIEKPIKQIVQEAVKDMYNKVKFDEGKHVYHTKEDDNWLQGVSTVSSIVPKPWLSAWGAKETVKHLGYSDYDDTEKAEEMLELIKGMELDEYLELLQTAKKAQYRKSKEALIDGTEGHEWLERYVLSKIRGEETPEIPEDNLKRPITQFIEWAEENVKEWLLSEARICYPEKGYAGTLDAMAVMKDDKLAVIDFKFASNISEDYYLQTAGYAMAFEPYDIKVDKRIIVRLPKTLYLNEWDKVKRKYKKVENKLEVVEVDTDYEEDKEVFLHCLPLKSWINKVTN